MLCVQFMRYSTRGRYLVSQIQSLQTTRPAISPPAFRQIRQDVFANAHQVHIMAEPTTTSWIVALVTTGLGLLMLGFGVYFLFTAQDSTSWPVAQGVIERVAIRTASNNTSASGSGSPRYYAAIAYRYTVDGQAYRSSRFSLGSGNRMGKMHKTREAAREAASAYSSGDPIRIYYDPADPAEAVLRAGANGGTYVPLVLGLLVGALGAWMLHSLRS